MKILPISNIPIKLKQKVIGYIGKTVLGTVTHVVTDKPIISLTFDDGPDPYWTPQYLQVLKKYNALATFFVVGSYVNKYKNIVEDIYNSGHSICNHSWNHRSFPGISREECRQEVLACEKEIAPFTSYKIFRPPFGEMNWSTRIELKKLGYTVVTANRHAYDWENKETKWMADLLISRTQSGDIILMHDILFDRRDCSRSNSLNALKIFLENSSKQFRFVTIPTLLQSGKPVLVNWNRESNSMRDDANKLGNTGTINTV